MIDSLDRRQARARSKLGKNIRLKRHQLELTQEALAERAGLHPTYISSVERGQRNISLDNMISLAQALNCNLKELIPDG